MENLVNIHSHKRQSEGISIVNKFIQNVNLDENNDGPFSAGIHPWHIPNIDKDKALNSLETLCKNDKMIAVGECGIDRSVAVNLEKQIDIFLRQNEIAIANELPVIIHSVKSYSDFLYLLKQGHSKTPWVFHGFNGNFQIAKRLVDYGAYISLGSSLLKDFSKTLETLQKTPLQRIFLETDENDISITEIYKKAAEIKGFNYSEFVSQIYQNFIYCFNYGYR